MQKKYIKGLRIIIVLAIVGAFIWFLVLSPMISFHQNEKVLEDAAKRYYEINPIQLPTGERVKTLSLNTLYKQSYLKDDMKIPYTNKLCSIEKSWVKVRRENGEYRYYVYLDCGVLKSSIDHVGPQVKLKGKTDMVVHIGDKFKDPGIQSVVDNTDGKLEKDTVTVKSDVDINKVGSYEITYTAYDQLRNKTVVTRNVTVVKVLNSIVKKELKNTKNYIGSPDNNYVRLSNMIFRIYGLDEDDNVVLVAEEDVANVNYTKIEKWLDEVYIPHFTEEAKALLVKSKFCNMKIDEKNLDTTQCTSYTEKRYAYVPSVIDINRAMENGNGFMKTKTISWTGNSKSDKEAYVTRNMFYGDQMGKDYLSYSNTDNYGVRPKIIMKGDTLITGGDGSKKDPYVFGETQKAKGGSLLNERYSGEYLIINSILWRIIEVEDDGTTKVITDGTLGNYHDRPLTYSNPEEPYFTYNPKDRNNYGYYINNSTSEYIDTSYFVVHEISAPVYKEKIIYGAETKNNKYKVKLSPPNMYDMFSAQSIDRLKPSRSYWLINSSTSKKRYAGVITDIGVPVNEEEFPDYDEYGVRAVAFVKKNTVISSGKGTYYKPYILK